MRDPDAPALIWAAEEAPDTLHTLSLGGLHREAMRFAAALRTAGFSPGEMKMENMTHLQASCTSVLPPQRNFHQSKDHDVSLQHT